MSGSPLACDPQGIAAEERDAHFARIERLFGSVLERTELTDGIAFRFSAELFPEVARFVENERRCCPFLAFTIDLRPAGGDVTLRLTGPQGVQEFLAAELDVPRPGTKQAARPSAHKSQSIRGTSAITTSVSVSPGIRRR